MSTLTKLRIDAYAAEDYSGGVQSTFTAQANPEKYAFDYAIEWDETAAMGDPNATLKYQRSMPRKMNFELLFDGTGVADPPASNNTDADVASQLAAFEDVVFKYNGNIHCPNYLMICWGSTLLPCRLTGMTVNYTLFAPTGEPLRARASVSFKEFVDPATLQKDAAKKSPDLTHIVRVKAGDTLPRMTFSVYGDSRFYLDVARHNHLVDFRDLKPGQELFFPPLGR